MKEGEEGEREAEMEGSRGRGFVVLRPKLNSMTRCD